MNISDRLKHPCSDCFLRYTCSKPCDIIKQYTFHENDIEKLKKAVTFQRCCFCMNGMSAVSFKFECTRCRLKYQFVQGKKYIVIFGTWHKITININ